MPSRLRGPAWAEWEVDHGPARMNPHWQEPPAVLQVLYGLAVIAAIGFPLWCLFSKGEVSGFLLFPDIALLMLIVGFVSWKWQSAIRVLGVLAWMFVLLFYVHYLGLWKF